MTCVHAESEISVGVIASLTGEFAKMGQDSVDALTLAAEEVARERGLKVKLKFEDDGFSTAKALSAYKKLTAFDKIKGLISVSSVAASAIKPYVTKAELPTAQVFLETESLEDPIVQLAPNMDAAERALGEATKKITKGKAVLVVPTNDTWLRLAKAFEQGFGTGVIREEIPVSEYDLRALVLRVLSHNPERVVLLLGPEQGPLVLKQLLEQLPAQVTFAFDANFLSGVDAYKKQIPDLSRIYDAPIVILPNVEDANFRKKFRQRFNREAGPWTEYSYDAFTVLIKSYNSDPKLWIKNMHQFKEVGTTGYIAFDALGVRRAEFMIKTIKEIL